MVHLRTGFEVVLDDRNARDACPWGMEPMERFEAVLMKARQRSAPSSTMR